MKSPQTIEEKDNDLDLSGFNIVKLHYSADPEKDAAWANKTKAEYATDVWNREFELQAVGHAGNYPVFGDYKKHIHESKTLGYDSKVKLIVRGWDFGKVHPCVEFLQINGLLKNFIGEVYGTNIFLPQFTAEVIAYSKVHFPGAQFVDWVDATGKNERDNGLPSIQVLRNYGLEPRWRMQDIEEGIGYIQHELITFSQGRPQIMINPEKCPNLVASWRNGYKRDKHGKPIKDGTFDHAADAARYAVSGVVTGTGLRETEMRRKLKEYRYKPRNVHTGY
jgi:hypothetical protein